MVHPSDRHRPPLRARFSLPSSLSLDTDWGLTPALHPFYPVNTQRRARALLAAKGLLVQEVDGADPACVETRAELWALAGANGGSKYPQFFLEVRDAIASLV